jgi:hypothetical protein
MHIYKKSGEIYFTSMKFEELITLLKIQIPCKIIFSDTEEKTLVASKTIFIGERKLVGRVQSISYTINEKEVTTTYNDLLELISTYCNGHGYTFSIVIEQNDFRDQESLLRLIPEINLDVIQNCVYLKFENDVYVVMYKPFENNDSNSLYYFETNNTLLAFTEKGPELLTENPNISNITDIICN